MIFTAAKSQDINLVMSLNSDRYCKCTLIRLSILDYLSGAIFGLYESLTVINSFPRKKYISTDR